VRACASTARSRRDRPQHRQRGQSLAHIAIVDVVTEEQRVGGLADALLLGRLERGSAVALKGPDHAAVGDGTRG
jgi:hypothetical protein